MADSPFLEEHQSREDLEAMDNLEIHVNVGQIFWAVHPPVELNKVTWSYHPQSILTG